MFSFYVQIRGGPLLVTCNWGNGRHQWLHPRPRFNMMYGDSHVHGDSFTGKTIYLYWDGPLFFLCYPMLTWLISVYKRVPSGFHLHLKTNMITFKTSTFKPMILKCDAKRLEMIWYDSDPRVMIIHVHARLHNQIYFPALMRTSGPRLNIKTVLSTYGDFHVKDKTAVRTSYL